MCGIAGIVNFSDRHEPPRREQLEAMVNAIRYRGPDESGLYRDLYAGLAHARLSIIDVTSGQQPMSTTGEKIWIVFNGEIFNYVELRDILTGLGHPFRTHSDTEVILRAYLEWGTGCFNRFNGQWALAIWDSEKRELVLSRDRVGVRPLFVHEADGRLFFASEVKAMFTHPDVPRRISPAGLDQTFTYWSTVAPVTMFDGIEELRPGSFRIYSAGGQRRDALYWSPSFPDGSLSRENHRVSLAEATEMLVEKLREATRLRMLRADVPVGAYLSGGIDSSVLARLAHGAREGKFRTFSIGFEDEEFDESSFQQIMAKAIGAEHEQFTIARSDIARVFPDVVYHAERPVLRTAPAPLFLLSERVRDAGIKCVLTGEGADEMLEGYDIFRETKIRLFMARQPESLVRPKLFNRLYPYLARSPQQSGGLAVDFWKRGLEDAGNPGFSHQPRWTTTSALKRFFSRDLQTHLETNRTPSVLDQLPPEIATWDPLARAEYLEVATLLSGYLLSSQGDRMMMAHSVEGRFPYLDAGVIEFCHALPVEYKLIGLNEKHILKRAAKGLIPDEIIRRKKQPYRAPDAASFLTGRPPEYAEELLSEKHLAGTGLFNPAMVHGLYKKCAAKLADASHSQPLSNSDNMAIVGILSSQILHNALVQQPIRLAPGEIRFTTDIDRSGVGVH